MCQKYYFTWILRVEHKFSHKIGIYIYINIRAVFWNDILERKEIKKKKTQKRHYKLRLWKSLSM